MQEQGGHDASSSDLAQQARAAGGGAASGDEFQALKDAVQAATPDERGSASKQLADDEPAYEALHRALQELGISEQPD